MMISNNQEAQMRVVSPPFVSLHETEKWEKRVEKLREYDVLKVKESTNSNARMVTPLTIISNKRSHEDTYESDENNEPIVMYKDPALPFGFQHKRYKTQNDVIKLTPQQDMSRKLYVFQQNIDQLTNISEEDKLFITKYQKDMLALEKFKIFHDVKTILYDGIRGISIDLSTNTLAKSNQNNNEPPQKQQGYQLSGQNAPSTASISLEIPPRSPRSSSAILEELRNNAIKLQSNDSDSEDDDNVNGTADTLLSEDKKEALAGIEAFNKLLFMWNPSNRSEPVPVKAGVNSRPSGTFQPYIDKLIAQCKEILNEINDLSNIYRKGFKLKLREYLIVASTCKYFQLIEDRCSYTDAENTARVIYSIASAKTSKMFSVRRNAESYIKDGKFKEFTQGKHVKTMSIFYLPEVKQQILQLCDEKSVANKGKIDPLQIARDVNSILIPKLNASGLQCKDAHMRPSLMRKILKEIGYAQKYHDGHEYYLKVAQFDVTESKEQMKKSGARLLVGASQSSNK